MLQYLQSFIRDIDDKIEINKQHLGQLENSKSESKVRCFWGSSLYFCCMQVQGMRELSAQIDEKMAKSEELGKTILVDYVTVQ